MIPFNVLPELANRYLAPPNPVVIYYTVNPTAPPPERPAAWDIELKLEDIALKSKMQSVTLNASRDTLRELTKLDDEVRSGAMPSCIELTIAFRRSRRSHSRFNHPS
jgi:SWI/SNF-related matrix-associated actin-dependent regulator of chromatin subfamily D